VKNLAALFERYSFLRFGLVGGAGYFVDVGVLAFDTSILGMAFIPGRACSVFIAMCFTWLGNRYVTFRARRARGAKAMAEEWLKFMGANAVGATVNYASSVVLVHFAPFPLNEKFIAQACGVLLGMVFNFTLSNKLVFKGPI
jgi:putative flippase GtrA